jgi:cysteinyl-tRNA synthetase
MKIYNSQSGNKEDFKPLKKGEVSIYVCGMTVYDSCHVGHARTVLSFDMMVRFFKFVGYKVNYVRNITDVDDKIIKKAEEEKVSFNEISEKYAQAMHDDFISLNMLLPSVEPKVTDHMDEILQMIETLEDNGYAYSKNNSDVYFDIKKYPEYGNLSKRVQEDLDSGSRIEIDLKKNNPNDFVLWKVSDNKPCWDSRWGKGRPGWHIECSAMSKKYLGNNFDIHGGGLDLKFPHHENEIAQSKCATNSDFARFWVHVAPLNIDGKKMSKSLDNFHSIKEVLKRYHPEVIRIFFLLSHYRNPINYSFDQIDEAKNILDKLYESLLDVDLNYKGIDSLTKNSFIDVLKDDFNSSQAIKILQKTAQNINSSKLINNEKDTKIQAKTLIVLGEVMGILQSNPEEYFQFDWDGVISSSEINELIEERNIARLNKDFSKADKIREKLLLKNIVLEDKEGKTSWKKLS